MIHSDSGPDHGSEIPGSPQGELLIRITVGRDRLEVKLEARRQGSDLVVTLGGGAVHVGAVAVAEPPQGAGKPDVQLIVLGRHKEGPLARYCAETVCAAARVVCVAVAGIHQDGASKDEIEGIVRNARQAVALLVNGLEEPG